jgi:glyceraldehyde 3-phosphate dehydrogenase
MTKKIKIAINGFGRIGRLTFRHLLKNESIQVVAINDLADVKMLAHLLSHDSVHGKLDAHIEVVEGGLKVGGTLIQVTSERNPENLPWKEKQVDIVIESTGRFVQEEDAGKHLQAGAKRVIISAPAKGDVKTVVLGVNHETLTAEDKIVSNASCTTNCLAPMAKVIEDNFGIEKGYISTVHAYTADQNLQDAPHKDYRRARAAALSIIPTTTGAASAVGKVLPKLQGKLDGIALRVPIPNGSLTDFTAIVKTEVTTEEVNKAFEKAAKTHLKGILEYSSFAFVSVDIVGNSHSCILDAQLTSANGKLIKMVGWYDNEYAYSCRTAELANLMASFQND